MCFAIAPLAGFAISAAGSAISSVAGFVQQGQAADYQAALNERNRETALSNAANQSNLLSTRRIQESQAAAQQVAQSASEARRARSTAQVAAGEAGVAGNSVNALLEDFERQELDFQSSVLREEAFRDLQFGQDQTSIFSGAKSRIGNLPAVRRPNFLNLGLQIGTGVAGAFNSFSQQDVDGDRSLFA